MLRSLPLLVVPVARSHAAGAADRSTNRSLNWSVEPCSMHLLFTVCLLSSACAGVPAAEGEEEADTASDGDTDTDFDDTPPCDALVDPWTATTAEEVMAAYRFAPVNGNTYPDWKSGVGLIQLAYSDSDYGEGDCPSLEAESDEDRQLITIDEDGCTTGDGHTWSGWGQSDEDGLTGSWQFRHEALRLESAATTAQVDGAYDYHTDDSGNQSFRVHSTVDMSIAEYGSYEATSIGHGEEDYAGWALQLYIRLFTSSYGVIGDYCVAETRAKDAQDGAEWTDLLGGSDARIVWTGAEGCGDVTIDGVPVGSACQ